MKSKTILLALLLCSISLYGAKTTKLVILHTNDTHSQIEPTTTDNMGGYARRLGMINKVRAEEKNVLLFDAGDFFQGTPYFNLKGGRVEAQALRMMKYDAVIFGNHEFDNGMDSLAEVLKEYPLPLINSNYELTNTPLASHVKPYNIFTKGGVKVGVFGLGVNLKGLAFQKNYQGLLFLDPVAVAVIMSNFLKNELKCDVVICLSHLGVDKIDSAPTDYDVIAASTNIDVVIGGHSHKLIENTKVNNIAGKPVVLAQMGKSGMRLGRIDLIFETK